MQVIRRIIRVCTFRKYIFSEDNLHVSPLERSYKGKVLAHYPENIPSNPFDESAVCMVIEYINLREVLLNVRSFSLHCLQG